MGRLHLFEFNDQEWLPDAWRRYITQYLQFMLEHGPFDALPGLLSRLANRDDARVLALCSGSGGPWPAYLEDPHEELGGVEVLLTDIRPDRAAQHRAEERTEGRAVGYDQSVDATDVPEELDGPRTIVNALHQFPPDTARAILADAVEKRVPIGVFEIMDRRPSTVFSTVLVPLFVLLLTPFVRPLRLGRFFWTYLIPLMPLLIFWDGLVSALRTYTPDELREMVSDFDEYEWEIDAVEAGDGPGPAKITYLIGRPSTATD